MTESDVTIETSVTMAADDATENQGNTEPTSIPGPDTAQKMPDNVIVKKGNNYTFRIILKTFR